MVEEDKTLKEKIDFLMDKYQEPKKKEKKFKIPWGIRLSKGKLKKNFILVLFIYSNGNSVFKFEKIEDGTVNINGIYYSCDADYILKYKKWPLIILPEWNISPIKDNTGEEIKVIKPWNPKETLDYANMPTAERVILNKIKLEMVKPKMKINFTVILIVLALLAGGYWALTYFKII
jgi:hypothetical protein